MATTYAANKMFGGTLTAGLKILAKPFMEYGVNGAGAKGALDYVNTAVEGDSMAQKAVKGLFKPSVAAATISDADDCSRSRKLDGSLAPPPYRLIRPRDASSESQDSSYLPAHGQALGQTTATAVNYLNGLRPSTSPAAPLDNKPAISRVAQRKYNNALDIAQQPLKVLDMVKNGNITQTDVQHIKTMYPALYNQLHQQVMNNMIDMVSKGNRIPYSMRLGLSTFLGSPLDSSMNPMTMMAAQPQPAQQPQPPKSKKALEKLPSMYKTPGQASEERRTSEK